jgi:hypothetical protein
MLTRQGFIGLFWETLSKKRKENDKITHKEVYESLESEYIDEFGQRKYSCFESFRSNRDR